jgi:glycosyltransferase involved in cell wall biosynthesis
MTQMPTTRSEAVRKQISRIGSADIVIGIPSYNNARTIGHVVRAVQAGLSKYFSGLNAVLVNADGGSTDGTREVVNRTTVGDSQSVLLQRRLEPLHKIVLPYHGIPGKGSAFRTVFEIAAALDAKACAVVDSDLRSITPEWIELLVKPIMMGGFDYVAPLYHRHKYDGTITNSIIYPLTRALYGKRVRQPIGGDFGFSGELARYYTSKDVWQSDIARFGIDIWMTTEAIANGFRIAQAFLGAKIHDPKDPATDLSSMLYQVVGSSFSLMESYRNVWGKVVGSKPVPLFGFHYTVGLERVEVDVSRMIARFRGGVKDLRRMWSEIIGQGDMGELDAIGKLPDAKFRFPIELWTRIVYDFALAYHARKFPYEHLLKSLTPLYLGKTASFIMEAENMDQDEAEAEIERLCIQFETHKPHLVRNWK